jgi:hypothetical protein
MPEILYSGVIATGLAFTLAGDRPALHYRTRRRRSSCRRNRFSLLCFGAVILGEQIPAHRLCRRLADLSWPFCWPNSARSQKPASRLTSFSNRVRRSCVIEPCRDTVPEPANDRGRKRGRPKPLGLQPFASRDRICRREPEHGQATLRQHYVIDIFEFIYAK